MSSLKIRVDPTVLHHVFDEGFGGIDNFADVWSGIFDDDEPTTKPQRSVKTIYAWLKHGLPTSRDTAMRFFGAAGIDPVAAIDLEEGRLQKLFARIRRAFLLGGLNIGGFRPLFELYLPSSNWPDAAIAKTYFGLNWHKFDFDHDCQTVRNQYVTIGITGDPDLHVAWPRAFHLAYRRQINADGLWRPFGTIITRLNQAILIHENGDVRRQQFGHALQHHVRFKTWFGPEPAEFRLACLHPFEAVVEPVDDPSAVLLFQG